MATLGSNTNIEAKSSISREQKLNFYEQQIVNNYIAPQKNLNNDGVLQCQTESEINIVIQPTTSYIQSDSYLDFNSTTATTTTNVTTQVYHPVNVINKMTKQEKVDYFEEQITNNYVAPQRNKHIFGVLPDDDTNSFYYSPNYNYGTDDIAIEDQVVVIDSGGGGGSSCNCNLYWQDLNV